MARIRIEVATDAGHCFGINRALDLAIKAACDGSAATLGPLLHNPQQVKRLETLGVRIIDSAEDAGAGETVVVRSHGVSPEELERLDAQGARVIDATCPHVKRIHERVLECGRAGQAVVILGEKDHPEVIATKAWAGDDAYVVESEADIDALPPLEAACAVAQTTLPANTYDVLIAALSVRVPSLTAHNTICEATRSRQDAAVELAGRMDAMLVIGGRNSANTRKLARLSAERCARTYHIETAVDIPWTALRFDDNIGITAGASTPDWIIKEVVTAMNDHIENIEGQTVSPDAAQEVQAAHATEQQDAQPVIPDAQEGPVTEPATQEAEEPQESSAPTKEDNIMEAYEKTLVSIKPGQTIQGTVVQITADEVCVNIGYKSDGLIKRADLASEGEPSEAYKIGDVVEVEIVKVNDGEGNVVLSQRNVIAHKNWEALVAKNEAGEFIEGVGREVVKGGLIATVMGVRAFVPASQLSERYVERIEQFVGQPMTLKIIEMDDRKRRIVASRKQVVLEQMAKAKAEIWGKLSEGDVIKGVVRRLTDFGAFVDIGGVDGLVHVTDLSWGRVAHPSDVVKIGQEIDVQVLKLDTEKEHISLGYKQLQPKPWDTAVDKYEVNSIVQGKVMRMVTFGAFVELEPGLDGLVHISEVSDRRIGKVEDVLKIGDIVNVKVLSVNPENKRISLSIREAMPEEEVTYEAAEDADAGVAYEEAATEDNSQES